MPTAVRVPLSFLLAMVMAITIGLTLAGPAQAVNFPRPGQPLPVLPPSENDGKTPVTLHNPIGTYSGSGKSGYTDLVFWRGTTGASKGDTFVVNKNLLDSSTFAYRNSSGKLLENLTFQQAASTCDFNIEECQAQVVKNMTQVSRELREAVTAATSQCGSTNRKLLFSVSKANRFRLITIGAAFGITFPAFWTANYRGGQSKLEAAENAAIVASGVALSALVVEFITVASQRNLDGETIVTWNFSFDRLRALAASVRGIETNSEVCTQAVRDLESGSEIPSWVTQTEIAGSYLPRR